MKKIKFLAKIALCVILIVAMLTQATLLVFAQEETLYLKEVQISTGKTAEEAKSWLIENGYTVLNEDLNAGTGKDYSYIGYKTTTNKDEAICDISMMSMESGYKMMNYGEMIKQSQKGIEDRASEMLVALSEFRANYAAGSPNARIAKETLDIFRAGENDSIPLGDYLLDPARTVSDIVDILLMSNTLVFTLIYNQVVLGVADYNQDGEDGAIKTWVDRLSEIGPLSDELTAAELDELDDLYYEKAEKLEYSISNFVEKLYDAIDRLDTNGNDEIDIGESVQSPATSEEEAFGIIESMNSGTEVDASDMDMLLVAVYETLAEYEFGDIDVGWCFENYWEEEDIRMLYPLVMSLTDGQLAMMQISGVANMTLAMQNTEEVYNDAKAQLDVYGAELIEANNGVNPSVFLGVNKELYKEEVGLTTEAARVAATSANYNQLTEENALRNDLKTALQVCGGIALAAAGIVTISTTIVGAVVGASGFFATLACIATSTMATVGSFAVSIATLGPAAIAVLAVVTIIVVLTIWLVDIIKEAWNDKHPEYTKIPASMYDYDANSGSYIRYEAVKERDGDPGDVNCFQARRWNALYVSYDKASGSPITANEMGEFFRVKRGDPNVVDKYEGVSNFGENNPVNLNSYTYKDKVNGIYLFYTTEDSLAGVEEEIKSGRYLYSIMVATNENPEAAKLEIKNKTGYELLDFNLTPGQKKATYLGYRTIDNPNQAITDIRIAWNSSGDIKFGNGAAAYANAGTYSENNSLQGISIYYTKDLANGDPILADFYASRSLDDVPEGYEPVNLFSGGPAFNLNYASNQGEEQWSDRTFLYFRYDTPYEGKAIYLGGLTFFEIAKLETIGGTVKFTGFDEYAQDLGWSVFDTDLKSVTSSQKGKNGLRLAYTVTNNPKRAIYDIRTYLAEPKATQVMSNINFDGVGFVSVERSIVNSYTLPIDKSVVLARTFAPSHSFLENPGKGNAILEIAGTKNGEVPTTLYAGLEKGYVTEMLAPRCIGLYVSGPTTTYDSKGQATAKTPILMSEFYLGDAENAPSNLKAVVDFTDCYGERPTDLSATMGKYIYYNQTFPEKLKYIESIEVVYSETENFSQDEAKIQLLAGGGHEILDFNLASVNGSTMYEMFIYTESMAMYNKAFNSKYDDRSAFIRVTRTKTKAKAIEDIRIVEVGKDDPVPPDSPKINGYTYKKVSNLIHCLRVTDGAFSSQMSFASTQDHYFYIYTGGNGVALTDISFSQNAMNPGTYSVINQNNYANPQNPWWIQMHSPEITESAYISRVGVVSAGKYDDNDARIIACGVASNPYNRVYCELLNQGFTQCIGMDFNHGTSDGDTVAIGYTLTNNPKNAVTNIITSEQNKETISVNGITYTRGTGVSLNATMKYGNSIYLYYTLDSKAGNLITGLSGALSTTNGVEYLQRSEGGISNLNLNAADKDPDCKDNSYLPAVYVAIQRNGAVNKNASLSASVFAENPQMKLIIVMAGAAALASVITVIIKKAKQKNSNKKENVL